MPTTKQDIARWLKEGLEMGATHTIVVCDTFDYDDYPSHVVPPEDIEVKLKKYYSSSMQQVMEVYNHSISHIYQLAERRAHHVTTDDVPESALGKDKAELKDTTGTDDVHLSTDISLDPCDLDIANELENT